MDPLTARNLLRFVAKTNDELRYYADEFDPSLPLLVAMTQVTGGLLTLLDVLKREVDAMDIPNE